MAKKVQLAPPVLRALPQGRLERPVLPDHLGLALSALSAPLVAPVLQAPRAYKEQQELRVIPALLDPL